VFWQTVLNYMCDKISNGHLTPILEIRICSVALGLQGNEDGLALFCLYIGTFALVFFLLHFCAF